MKILLIEDDSQIVEVITLTLSMRWPDAKIISTHLGEKGLEMVEVQSPDLVLLDLGLPDTSGYEVLKGIRLFSKIPIIVLTSRDDEADIVRGLELGADDYITKPFQHMELLSRIKSVIRRSTDVVTEQMELGDLRFDNARLEVVWKGRKFVLTRTEGDILYKLMKNSNQVVPYSDLAEAVWGSDYENANEALRVHIRRMREKIEVDSDIPPLILTRMGAGYYLNISLE